MNMTRYSCIFIPLFSIRTRIHGAQRRERICCFCCCLAIVNVDECLPVDTIRFSYVSIPSKCIRAWFACVCVWVSECLHFIHSNLQWRFNIELDPFLSHQMDYIKKKQQRIEEQKIKTQAAATAARFCTHICAKVPKILYSLGCQQPRWYHTPCTMYTT